MSYATLNLLADPKDEKLVKIKAKLLAAYRKEGTLVSTTPDKNGFTEYKFSINPIKYEKCKPAHPDFIPYDYPPVGEWDDWKTYFTYRTLCNESCTCYSSRKNHPKSFSTDSKDHKEGCPALKIINDNGFNKRSFSHEPRSASTHELTPELETSPKTDTVGNRPADRPCATGTQEGHQEGAEAIIEQENKMNQIYAQIYAHTLTYPELVASKEATSIICFRAGSPSL